MDTSHAGRKLTAQFKQVSQDISEVQDEQESIVGLLEHDSSRLDDMAKKTEQHEKQHKAHSSQFDKLSSQIDKLEEILKAELGMRPTSVAFNIQLEQWKVEQRRLHGEQKQSNENWKNEQTQIQATEKKQSEEAQKPLNDAIQQVRDEFGDAENERQRRIEALEKQLGDNQRLQEEFKRDVAQNEQRARDDHKAVLAKLRDSSATQAFQATKIEALLSRVGSMEAARAGCDQEVDRLSEAHNKGLEQQTQANTKLLNKVEALEADARDGSNFRGIAKPQIETAQREIAALRIAQGNCAIAA